MVHQDLQDKMDNQDKLVQLVKLDQLVQQGHRVFLGCPGRRRGREQQVRVEVWGQLVQRVLKEDLDKMVFQLGLVQPDQLEMLV